MNWVPGAVGGVAQVRVGARVRAQVDPVLSEVGEPLLADLADVVDAVPARGHAAEVVDVGPGLVVADLAYL